MKNAKEWEKCVEKNDDPYGKCCVDIAREIMKFMDDPKFDISDPHKVICDAEESIGEDGITGFQAGAIAQMVSHFHERGDEFRMAFNKEHGVDEKTAKGGIVNPAVMTIETGGENV
jgi:hypothetical protein